MAASPPFILIISHDYIARIAPFHFYHSPLLPVSLLYLFDYSSVLCTSSLPIISHDYIARIASYHLYYSFLLPVPLLYLFSYSSVLCTSSLLIGQGMASSSPFIFISSFDYTNGLTSFHLSTPFCCLFLYSISYVFGSFSVLCTPFLLI